MARGGVVVVGAGLAGSRVCAELREAGYAGPLTLVGDEPHLPYDRPPLSKAVLAGAAAETTLPTDLAALDVELRLGCRATAVQGSTLRTGDGTLPFQVLVVATGSVPVRLPGPGPQVTLRTIDDALALRERLRPGARVVLVGAGWIGAEVATAARAAGCSVVALEAGPEPLAQALGAEVGAATRAWWRAAGVTVRTGTAVASVEDAGVRLAGGALEPADVVVTGVGVRPATCWLQGAGIACDRGVLVDEWCRSGRPEVFAVGDCAAWWSRRFGARLRLEHWDNAMAAPRVAAAAIAGAPDGAPYDPVPYFWSDQFGRRVTYVGHRAGAARLVWRGDPGPEADGWGACWLDAGNRLVALVAVDRPRDHVQGRRVIAAGLPVDPARLADPARPVRDCLAG